MLRLIFLSSILIGICLSAEAKSGECNISGIWNHTAKPAKLLIDMSKGEISVYSHDLNPKSIGLMVLKNLKLATVESSWDAQMYSSEEDSFVDVLITAKTCNQLSVGFRGEEVLGLVR
jgi:hypothetical protein